MEKRSIFKNKSLWIVVVIIILGFNNIKSQQKITTPDVTVTETTPSPTIAPSQANSIETTQTDSEISAKPNEKRTYLVTRVIDGDTIEIETGQSIRYIGIDTPETVHPDKPAMCFGAEASQKNKDLVLGKHVTLEKDISEVDKYKRLLRHVWLDDVLISELLVKEGYAISNTYPPDVKYQELFVKAQKQAQQNKHGLWGKCNFFGEVLSSSNSAPKNDQNDCNIKGNISTNGEKIYHLPGCGSYSKTVIDISNGEKMFCTENEARQAGWRKAKNCN